MVTGRPFSQQDVNGATKVCLLGLTVVENFFGGIDPVGQIIRIKNVPFVVIGVLHLHPSILPGSGTTLTVLTNYTFSTVLTS